MVLRAYRPKFIRYRQILLKNIIERELQIKPIIGTDWIIVHDKRPKIFCVFVRCLRAIINIMNYHFVKYRVAQKVIKS